jgi:pyruvate,water dikinase
MTTQFDLSEKKSRGSLESDGFALLDRKYRTFKSLLAGNNQALELMTDLERMIYEGHSFTQDQSMDLAGALVGDVYDLVEDLNGLTDGSYPVLFERAESIGIQALNRLSRRKAFNSPHLVLGFEQLALECLDEVGGKAANLGEVANNVGLPTPKGFAVTASATAKFLRASGLSESIRRILSEVDVGEPSKLLEACDRVSEMIKAAPLPPPLEEALRKQAARMADLYGRQVRLAVRSSAVSEDSQASFAGQHSTVLGVAPEDIAFAWREVVSSMYTPRAIFYRRSKGYSDQDVMMSVLVLNMVPAMASGVVYTIDPNSPEDRDILISGVWGLGLSVVDGSMDCDFWRIRREDGRVRESVTADKPERLVLLPEGGIISEAVPHTQRCQPCLTSDEVRQLVEFALRLEEHYGMPLDVEWAMGDDGQILVIQARALMLAHDFKPEGKGVLTTGPAPLLQGGQSAAPGTAAGPVHIIHSDQDLHSIPQGAILVARQTSPAYVAAMGKVVGIVTEMGSVTGHMASVAREFGIPTLVGIGRAMHVLAQGQEITLDATNQVIYPGRVGEILSAKKPVNLMKGSPIYKSLQEALKLIIPLNLVDPEQPDFTPEGCRTLHDVIRFVHEIAMRKMFAMADNFQLNVGLAVPIDIGQSMKILAIDLDRGISPVKEKMPSVLTDLKCSPLKAFLSGLLFSGMPRPETCASPEGGAVAYGIAGANYAIITAEYMNLHVCLGSHFATVDSYCGPVINDNYILFSFRVGAKDAESSVLQAQIIAEIMRWIGFRTVQYDDSIRAEMKKYDQHRIMEKLDLLGRLLTGISHVDWSSMADVEMNWYVTQFLKGNYSFDRSGAERSE